MASSAANVALSLSGAGHLLPYHLAVCQSLMNASRVGIFPRIHAISGSSSGAIAAVVATRAFDRLSEFAHEYIQEKGNGLKSLRGLLLLKNEEYHQAAPRLYICTTRCKDGSVHVVHADTLSDNEELLQWVRASCTIPKSFHPADVLASSGSIVYPDADGIWIQGDCHVDGGIAGPAPPVPDWTGDVVVVSPISGSAREDAYRISPNDSSFAIWKELHCRGDFYVRPSIQNLKALRAASGSTTSQELQSWYEQGREDANKFLKGWRNMKP